MMLLRKPAVRAKCGWSTDTSVFNAMKAGTLTRPVAIGARAVAWPDFEVDAIVAARVAGQTDAQIRALVERLHARRAQMAQELSA